MANAIEWKGTRKEHLTQEATVHAPGKQNPREWTDDLQFNDVFFLTQYMSYVTIQEPLIPTEYQWYTV